MRITLETAAGDLLESADGRRCAPLRRFARDERGIGAIEFAILFPVLLMLYLGAFELTIALSV